MKLVIVLLAASLLERGLCADEDGEMELARTSRGLYANQKVMDNRNVFSPRMDYDEWTPLGRGDPLKNDPTYDYVPPVLERVHYWMEPSKRTPDPPVLNSGVLVLGSSRTEPTFAMRLTTPKYQAVPAKEPQADSRLDAMSLIDPFLKLMDVSKFGINLNPSTNANYYKPATNANRATYQRPMHHQHPQRYPQQQQQQQQPQALQRPPYTMLMPPPPPPPAAPSTATSVATFATTTTTTEMPKTPSLSPATTVATTKSNRDANLTTAYPTTVIANTENVYKPVAIAMPEDETIRNDAQTATESRRKKPEDETAVLPIVAMFNKAEDQQQQQHKQHGNAHRLKEPYKYRPLYEMSQHPNLRDNNLKQPNPMMTPPPKAMKMGEKLQSGHKWGANNRATTTRPMTTTVANTLTTDPMFKHYKQPSEPIKGPFYLIIQGHSKVKTYGASKNPINGLLTSNEIREDAEDKRDRFGEFYDLESQEVKRKRGKSLAWYTDAGNHLGDDDGDRRKRFEEPFATKHVNVPAISELSLFDGVDNMEHLEEAFGKSEGGTSKKRYLVDDMINDTDDGFVYDVPAHANRQLLGRDDDDDDQLKSTTSSPQTMITLKHPSTPSSSSSADNFDVESFIALNDDYSPEDVVSLLLKEEGQGSGFGNFVVSIFSKSLKERDDATL